MQILEHILKIRREKAKHEFSQTVGNQLATIWHCEMWFANFALRISHCQILQPQNTVHLSHTKMQNLSENSHCQICSQIRSQIRNQFRIAKFAMWFFALRNSLWFFALRNFALRNSLWFFALPNSQCGFSHCEIRCGFSHCEISHCEIRCGFSHCEIRNTLRTVCELIAKIPTVLPSDFVLRITFSSELRFRRFWYRWKA